MKKVLQIQFKGWTASPRMPFILSGNSICMHTPSYSTLLGVLGCCLGRPIAADEVKIGFFYKYNSVGMDVETRHRLENKQNKIKPHPKGTDAYYREFHILPELTVWIDRVDWKSYFQNPIGSPSLGASQDLLKIESVQEIDVDAVESANISGTMIPFNSSLRVGGQLVQLAEYYQEADDVEGGRIPKNPMVFIAIPYNSFSKLKMDNLFKLQEDKEVHYFYMHEFGKNA